MDTNDNGNSNRKRRIVTLFLLILILQRDNYRSIFLAKCPVSQCQKGISTSPGFYRTSFPGTTTGWRPIQFCLHGGWREKPYPIP